MSNTDDAERCDVLLTYSWNRVGYNILRSLSSHGLKVWTADTSRHNICSMSRFAAGSVTYPDPFTQEEAFISSLLGHVERLRPVVLLPTHDESPVIARHRHRFPDSLIIPVADDDLQLRLANKATATKLAQAAGVPVPQVFTNAADAVFPCVFKTAIGNSAKTVFYPADSKELEDLCSRFSDRETLIEEFVPGTDHSVDCVRWNGRFYASVYKALVTKTPQGGTTTQREIVDEPQLVEYARRLLEAVDYNGVCGIDFKFDPTTRRAAFIEVNARFTGGIATPITAGFDIPYVLYCLATGQEVPENETHARTGVRTKWILGDVITAVGLLLSLKCTPSRMKPLIGGHFDAYDDYRADDRRAILGEMRYYLSKLIKNRRLNP